MRAHLVYGRALITGAVDRHRAEVIEDGAVYAEDGGIVAVGRGTDLNARYPEAQETGWVLLPGLVNAHHHVGLSQLQLGSLPFATSQGLRRVPRSSMARPSVQANFRRTRQLPYRSYGVMVTAPALDPR